MKKNSVLSNYMAKRSSKARARDGSIPVVEVESLLSGYFKMIGRRGGSASSKIKSDAARANGKLGGRPRKRQSKTPANAL